MLDANVQTSPVAESYGLNRAVGWKLKLCWTPKNCYLSGKQLWGKRAYYGERMIAGPGDPVVDEYWIEKDEFMLWQLTRKF